MTTVRDVAQYILNVTGGPMSTMKLQKLTYYSQALHCAAGLGPMFSEGIEAWRMGPVCRDLYNAHKGKYSVTSISRGNAGQLTSEQKRCVESVLKAYGGLTGKQLSDMTHAEDPWISAFDGDDEYPNTEITPETLASYYGKKWGAPA